MADNVQISDNPIIAADVIGGVSYQRTKTTWGVDGVAVDASATNPLPVSAAAIESAIETVGSVDVMNVVLRDQYGNLLSFASPYELTSSVTIHSSDAVDQYDCLHTGYITLSNAARANGGTGRILGARLVSKSDTFDGTVWAHVFRKAPTNSTFTADSALAINDTDKLEKVGALKFDFSTFPPDGGGKVATADRSHLPLDYKCDAGTSSLFIVLQMTTAFATAFGASDFVPFFLIAQD